MDINDEIRGLSYAGSLLEEGLQIDTADPYGDSHAAELSKRVQLLMLESPEIQFNALIPVLSFSTYLAHRLGISNDDMLDMLNDFSLGQLLGIFTDCEVDA